MKRLSLLMVGALMLSAPVFTSWGPAGASTANPNAVAGTYDLHVNWVGGPGWDDAGTFTLFADGTGKAGRRDTITWSLSDRTITLTFTSRQLPDRVSTFVGVKNRVGFSKQRNPGTMSNNHGGTGIWYAVKTS